MSSAKDHIRDLDETAGGLKERKDDRENRHEPARNGTVQKGLTPRQEKAITLLGGGLSVAQVAREIGAGKRTLFRWLRQRSFQHELLRAREQNRRSLESRVLLLAEEATVVLQQALRSRDPEHQLEAARLVLAAAVRMVTRHKEPQVDPDEPPRVPLIVFPPGTRMSWMNRDLPAPSVPLEVEAEDAANEQGQES